METQKIYLDANVFLFAFLDSGELGEKCRSVLERVQNGALKGYTSCLTFDEVFWNIKKFRTSEQAIAASKVFLHFPRLQFIETSAAILHRALELIETYHLDPRDAIHAATALQSDIVIVISDDKDFDRIKELRRQAIK